MVADFSSQCLVQLGGLPWSPSCAIGHLQWRVTSYMFNYVQVFLFIVGYHVFSPFAPRLGLGHSSYCYYYTLIFLQSWLGEWGWQELVF